MFNATDDDEFFTPTASASNLANLFGISNPQVPIDYNSSLTYTAPRQPKSSGQESSKTSVASNKSQSKVYCAKAVHVHKLINATYSFIGKHGLAIIGDETLNSFEIILYKDKQNVQSRSKLISTFKFINEPEKSIFTDDAKQSFHVYFETVMDSKEFLTELEGKGIEIEYHEIAKPVQILKCEKDDVASDSSGTQARVNILNRISKVGQSMLPSTVNKPKSPAITESDTEVDEIKVKKNLRKPKRLSNSDKIDSSNPQYVMMNGEFVPIQTTMAAPTQFPTYSQQYSLINGQLVPSNSMPTMATNQIMHLPTQILGINDPMNIYFSENRTHNSEIRMNISQLSNKLDCVLNELSDFKTPENQFLHKMHELEIKVAQMEHDRKIIDAKTYCLDSHEIIEPRISNSKLDEDIKKKDIIIQELLNDIQIQKLKLKDFELFYNENKDNKKHIDSLNLQIENQNLIISKYESTKNDFDELIKNQKDENVLLQDSDRNRIETLNEIIETQILKIKELSESYEVNKNVDHKFVKNLEDTIEIQKLKIKDLAEFFEENKHNSDLKTTIGELEAKIKNQKLKIKDFEEFYEEHKNSIKSKQVIEEENMDHVNTIKILESKIENQKLKIKDFEEDFKLNHRPDKLELARLHDAKLKDFTENVKSAMNTMYQNILEKIIENDKLSNDEIKKVLSHNMKNATFQIINDFKNNSPREEHIYAKFGDINGSGSPPPIPEFEVTV